LSTEDRNFDDLQEKFERKIYGSYKGDLRLKLIWDDLEQHTSLLPNLSSLSILDIGGGLGQFSIRLAQLGARIDYCDISIKMLQRAEEEAKAAGVADNIRFIHAPFQQLTNYHIHYDFIVMHAVLEWLGDQRAALQLLQALLRPDGVISLMYFNFHSIVLKNMVRGNFKNIIKANYAGSKKSLTPTNPVKPEQCNQWIDDLGFQRLTETGIRCISDYHDHVESWQRHEREKLLEAELALCKTHPYLYWARYIHLLLK
jgi:S-adenosylmethionine-dependent methyltransferase